MSLPSAAEWLSFTLLAVVLAVDAGPWLQAMLARPLPAAALLGLMWGRPADGAFLGATLELVYAGVLPVGAARYPESGVAGLVGAGVALWTVDQVGEASILLGVLWGLAAGLVGRELETWRRARNVAWVARARDAAQDGDGAAFGRVLTRSLGFAALVGAGAAVALLALGILFAAPLVDMARGALTRRPPALLLAALGCAVLLRLWGGRRERRALAGGLVVGAALALLIGGASE